MFAPRVTFQWRYGSDHVPETADGLRAAVDQPLDRFGGLQEFLSSSFFCGAVVGHQAKSEDPEVEDAGITAD
jgi:hypothetical protein